MTKSRMIAWTVWMIVSIFYAYQYILRVMPNIMMDDIIQQFHIDAAVFGQFSGVYYIGYSLMPLPLGIMLDRYGPKKVVTGCIVMTVIGLLPIVFAENFVYPILGRALIGIGSSAAILCAFKVIRLTFKEQQFTRMLSLTVTIGLIGAIYGGGPVNYMCENWGYKSVVQIFIGVGLGLAAITYLLLPKEEEHTPPKIGAGMKQVFTNSKVMAICFSAGLMVGPLEGFADVWASGFLKEVYRFDADVAGYLPSMIFVGMCFGAPILGLVAEKTGQYLGVIIGAGLVMVSVFIALLMGWLTVSSMTVAFILVGVCCSYQILAIYKASTYVPDNVAGLTTAVANMIIMSFGYAFHTIIGSVVNAYGGIGVPQAFIYGISVIPLALGLGVMGFLTVACSVKEKRE